MHRAAAAAATVITAIVLAGCGNWVGDAGPPAGLTGISVTQQGDYIVELFVCRDEVDRISIVGDREGLDDEEENPVVQEYTAGRPLSGSTSLNLSQPEDPWSPRTATAFESGKGYIITAQGIDGTDNETVQLNLQTSSLETLEPGLIYASDSSLSSSLTAYSPAEFEAEAQKACS